MNFINARSRDLFGVSMVMPLILPYARDLGASPTMAGIVGSVYGALQLFSGPLIGQQSDSIGRHLCLWVCLAVSGVSYMLLALATSVLLLIFLRIPHGIFKHSQNISKTYLTDMAPESGRSVVLGNFNAASSIGFILGPLVGGHVAELPGGFQYVAIMSGLIFILNAVLVWCLLPTCSRTAQQESRDKLIRDESTTSLKKLSSDEISFSPQVLTKSFNSVDWPDLWDLFLIKFLAGFSVLVFRSNYTLVLRQKFSAGPTLIGYSMSYSGTMAAISGFGVGHFIRLYSSTARVFLHMLLLQCATLTLLTVAPALWVIFVAQASLSFVTATMRVVAIDLTIRRAGQQSRGALLGLSQSVMSLARMLSPFLAGLAQEVHIDGATALGVITTLIAIVLMLLRAQDPDERKRKQKKE